MKVGMAEACREQPDLDFVRPGIRQFEFLDPQGLADTISDGRPDLGRHLCVLVSGYLAKEYL
jgi:hypothetical protein